MTQITRSLLLLVCFSVCAFAKAQQNRDNYALLWKITSSESIKPSYIFGTAHLKDKRVFDFSDAMLPAIQSSEAFALEVHPDSIGAVFDKKDPVKENLNRYKQLLSKQQYDSLNKRVEKAVGESLDELEENSLYYLEASLRPDMAKDGDQSTFLDAYLYGMAYSMGKEIYGLERIEDQMPPMSSMSEEEVKQGLLQLLEGDTETYEQGIEELVEIYLSGDIQELMKMAQSDGVMNQRMIARNQVMANSMSQIMKSKALFAAVGAAHLPGEQGVLNLLRQRGYTVSKVESTFTGASNNYVIKTNLDSWKTFNDSITSYKVSHPNFTKTMPINDEITMQFSTDMVSGASFFHFSSDLRTKNDLKEETIIQNIINKFVQKADSTDVMKSQVQRSGTSFMQIKRNNANNDNITHIELVFNNRVLYVFGAEYDQSTLAKETAEAFFNSVTINTPAALPEIKTTWQKYTDIQGAFSVQIPGEITDMSRKVPNPADPDGAPYEMNMYLVSDRAKGHNYLIRYNNFPVGYYLEDESAIADEFPKSLLAKGSTLVSKKQINYKGLPGYDFVIKINNQFDSKVRYLSRGNRTYLLLAQNIENTDSLTFDNPVFNSFELLPFRTPDTELIVGDDQTYEFLFPKAYKKETTPADAYNANLSSSTDYSGLDVSSGGVYIFSEIKIKPWYKAASEKAFLDEYTDLLKDYGDSIYYQQDINFKGLTGREVYIKNDKTPVVQRFRLVLAGDKLLSMSTYQSKDELESDRVNQIFESMVIKKNNSFSITASKSKEIIKALSSKDTTVFNEAVGALDYYDFELKDLALLEKGLKMSLPEDQSYWGAKSLLIYSLGLLNTEKAVPVLKKHYLKKSTTNNERIMTFEALEENGSKPAIRTYMELLEQHPPQRNDDRNYAILSSDIDSVLTIDQYGRSLLKVYENEAFRDRVLAYFSRQLSSDSIYTLPYLQENKAKLTAYFQQDALRALETVNLGSPTTGVENLYYHLDVLDTLAIDDSRTLSLVKRLFQERGDQNFSSIGAFEYYIKYATSIDTIAVQDFLKSKYYRFEAMVALVDADYSQMIPSQYLDPKNIAEVSLYNTIGYDDSYPTQMRYQGEFSQDGKQYYAFVYSYEQDGASTEEIQDMEETKTATKEEFIGLVLKQEVALEDLSLPDAYYDYQPLGPDWKESAKYVLDTYK
ncbi:MAG: hypothetical protein CL867_03400 [Cytophagaceae bacterium]|nr:hypothetical protein [Cytophagaceae bacterium]